MSFLYSCTIQITFSVFSGFFRKPFHLVTKVDHCLTVRDDVTAQALSLRHATQENPQLFKVTQTFQTRKETIKAVNMSCTRRTFQSLAPLTISN